MLFIHILGFVVLYHTINLPNSDNHSKTSAFKKLKVFDININLCFQRSAKIVCIQIDFAIFYMIASQT